MIPENEQARADICLAIEEVKELLLEKNKKYGNAALNPVRIFSKCSPKEAILVRLDDKISRIISGQANEDEDVYLDLIGYLLLLRVHGIQQRRITP